MLIVKKFDGTAIADKEGIFTVAERCAEEYRKGNDVVVVLSTMGSYTEELIAQAKVIHPNPSQRDMDMLLSVGAQMSAAFMAMALETMDVPAISLNAFQTKIHTDGEYGSAKITAIETDRIFHELKQRKIVIVAGEQGIGENNEITTLRGGADAAAMALAEALGADFFEADAGAEEVETAA